MVSCSNRHCYWDYDIFTTGDVMPYKNLQTTKEREQQEETAEMEIGRRRSKMRLEYSILTSLMIMFMLTIFNYLLDELMKIGLYLYRLL